MNKRAFSVFLGVCGTGAAALAISACATAPGSPTAAAAQSNNQCFLASQVNDFEPNADGTVDIQVGVNKYFRVTTDGMCQSMDFRTQVGIQSTSGSDFICNGYDAQFVAPNPIGPGRCAITGITALTKEQFDAARTAR